MRFPGKVQHTLHSGTSHFSYSHWQHALLQSFCVQSFLVLLPLLMIPHLERTMYLLFVLRAPELAQFLWAFANLRKLVLLAPIAFVFFPVFFLLHPQWSTSQATTWHEGAVPAFLPHLALKPELLSTVDSKLFWAQLFRREGVPHPALVGVATNGLWVASQAWNTRAADEQKALEFIVKPDHGTFGSGVQSAASLVEAKQVAIQKSLKEEAAYMVQLRVRDWETPQTPRHYRLVTMINSTLLGKTSSGTRSHVVSQLALHEVADPKSRTTSNRGRVHVLEGYPPLAPKLLTHDADANTTFRRVCSQLSSLHAAHFSDAVVIGWDIINSEKGPIVLEGNVGAGVCWGTAVPRECTDTYIKADALYRDFYAERFGPGSLDGAKLASVHVWLLVVLTNTMCVMVLQLALRAVRRLIVDVQTERYWPPSLRHISCYLYGDMQRDDSPKFFSSAPKRKQVHSRCAPGRSASACRSNFFTTFLGARHDVFRSLCPPARCQSYSHAV
eukprot:gnl/TRDRNA2_/TRDRNA2_33231_c0_seq1.p1 gnl/TRDRNA2_/TRDRNA2_33231_c0~~gnl/TRDRNA2_/TRDRNA2_33231_c0_seq1.p1  ORF type:complete len:500 (-),score=39.68 gnl/TRDRNA2_/TRDRNA2_33231_c0_seq1:77-1576(-)